MTALLADTHALVWFLEKSPKLSDPARAAMRHVIEAGSRVFISTVTLVTADQRLRRADLDAIW